MRSDLVLFINTHTHTHDEMKSKMQANYLGRNKRLKILNISLLNGSAVHFISSKDKSQFHPQ